MLKKLFSIFFLVSALGYSQQNETLTIYFDSGSSVISEVQSQKMVSFFSDKQIEISEIEIDGFCDDIGSDESNLLLSKKRAQAVAKFILDSFKIHVNSVSGDGEITFDGDFGQAEKTRSENRRATVRVTYFKNDPKDEETVSEDDGYKTFEDNLEIGDKVIVKQLLFDGSRTSFFNVEEAEAELAKIIDYFNKNPNVHFQIQGHVCCISHAFKDARNIETGLNNLSKARAQKIYDYFVAKGIAKNRMTHEGYGRQFPRKNVKESLNKRVEIVITKI